jgi:membrane protein implicated in regulation of membrane protease activity
MPGQRNWIVLLVFGVLALAIGLVGVIVGGGNPIVWLVFGMGLLIVSFMGWRQSRRFVQESLRQAAEDLRREG